MISVNYDGLWKILIDKKMKKKDLTNNLNIGTGTVAKMSKGEPVSLEVLAKICLAFKCNIEDVVRFVYE
jgi:DNA (cytosine-5)-methyltransferase 1